MRTAGLLAEGTTIGIGSPRASLEDNLALRALVGPERFYLGIEERERTLGDLAVALLRDGPSPSATLPHIQEADLVLVIGADLTNEAPILDLNVRTWLRLRPTSEEERLGIARWNDAALGRLKEMEPSALWVAHTHATKLDAVAGGVVHAAPDDLARLTMAVAHGLDPAQPAVDDLSDELALMVDAIGSSLRAAARPVVVTGTGCASEALLLAAARLAWSLPWGERRGAPLAVVQPEANTMGLLLMGGGRLADALYALRVGEADAAIVLQNDLERRAPAADVRAALERCPHVIALDHVTSATTEAAEIVLPTATWAESTGTFVSFEGRAQRFLRVFVPGEGVRPAWRWLRDLAAELRPETAPEWRTADDVTAELESMPAFAGVAAAAPPPGFRIQDEKIARKPARYSGRTAMMAHLTVFEPEPPDDRGSALAHTQEGHHGPGEPPALLPRYWAPGWNSGNALHKFQTEVNGPLEGGDVGVRLVEPRAGDDRHEGSAPPQGPAAAVGVAEVPPPFEPRPGEWLLVPYHHIFGSGELSMFTAGIAERAPRPYVALNEADAQRLGVNAGDGVDLRLDGVVRRLDLRLDASLPAGVAGLPVGLPQLPGVLPPLWARLEAPAGAGPRPSGAGAGTIRPIKGAAMPDVVSGLLIAIAVFTVALGIASGLIWYERRLLGFLQDRLGPDRVGPGGLMQVVADLIKIFTKEDWVPPFADRIVFVIAPAIVVTASLLGFIIIPVTGDVVLADLDVGLLFFLAMSSLAVYSIVLAGWSSRSKYSVLGSLRAAAQMLSYEVFMGLALMGVVIQAGTFSVVGIVEAQRTLWYVIPQLGGLIIFVIAAFGELRRIPFDLVEAESELVAGFHTEYSGMKFGMFYVGEYIAVTLVAALITTLFLGGWLGPVLPAAVWFLVKTAVVISFIILVRATFPRVRYDQLMQLGWKIMLPLALLNLLVTGAIVVARG